MLSDILGTGGSGIRGGALGGGEYTSDTGVQFRGPGVMVRKCLSGVALLPLGVLDRVGISGESFRRAISSKVKLISIVNFVSGPT